MGIFDKPLLAVTHPSCPVQEAEARAIIASSKPAGKIGPVDVFVSEFVRPGHLVVIDPGRLGEGLALPAT